MKKLLLITLLALTPLATLAQENTPIAGPQGLLTGLTCVADGNCQICDVMIVLNNIIKVILGLSGSIALLVSVIAGGYLLVSGGGEYKKKAYEAVKSALIGLAIIFFAYPMINLGLNLIMGGDIKQSAKLFGSNQSWMELCEDGSSSTTPAPTGSTNAGTGQPAGN